MSRGDMLIWAASGFGTV